MKITYILLALIIAFWVASWGRFLEWWNDLSPIWKTGFTMFVWGILVLIGMNESKELGFAAFMLGPVFIASFLIWLVYKL